MTGNRELVAALVEDFECGHVLLGNRAEAKRWQPLVRAASLTSGERAAKSKFLALVRDQLLLFSPPPSAGTAPSVAVPTKAGETARRQRRLDWELGGHDPTPRSHKRGLSQQSRQSAPNPSTTKVVDPSERLALVFEGLEPYHVADWCGEAGWQLWQLRAAGVHLFFMRASLLAHLPPDQRLFQPRRRIRAPEARVGPERRSTHR